MKRARLFVNADCHYGAHIRLNQDQQHYLKNVLRLTLDDEILIFNGKSGEWFAKLSLFDQQKTSMPNIQKNTSNIKRHMLHKKKNIQKQAEKQAIMLVCQTQTRQQNTCPNIELLFAPVKRTGTHIILEKATELGVKYLHPVKTKRTNTDQIHLKRWEAILREAAEQTERLDIPIIKPFDTLDSCLQNWEEEKILLVCDEGKRKHASMNPSSNHHTCPDPVTQLLSLKNTHNYKKFAILIGPEGGFTPEEQTLLYQQEFTTPIVLGSRILRAETAAISALTLFQSCLGDWSGIKG